MSTTEMLKAARDKVTAADEAAAKGRSDRAQNLYTAASGNVNTFNISHVFIISQKLKVNIVYIFSLLLTFLFFFCFRMTPFYIILFLTKFCRHLPTEHFSHCARSSDDEAVSYYVSRNEFPTFLL